jgi:hypothetical protein
MTPSHSPVPALLLIAACGGASSPGSTASSQAGADAATTSTAAPSSASGADDASGSPPASAGPATAPTTPGVPAADSWPEGVTPLSKEEGAELGGKCKPFTDAVTAAAKKAGRSKGSVDIARDVLANPPKVAGVDGPRCAELMGRELAAYRARTIEQEAMVGLKRIAFGMASHFAEAHGLCPSAPPVPAALHFVAKEPYVARADDWNDVAWACLRFDQQGPQRFVYLVRVDAANSSYEAIARGYPVEGAPPTELYVRVVADENGPSPNVTVMRRASSER